MNIITYWKTYIYIMDFYHYFSYSLASQGLIYYLENARMHLKLKVGSWPGHEGLER